MSVVPTKNLPGLMRLVYYLYNRGLVDHAAGGWAPVKDGNNKVVETFCNLAVNYLCTGFAYVELAGMNANAIVDFLASSPDWISQDPPTAQDRANNGIIVIAAWKNPSGGHGHVNIVIPGSLQPSGEAGMKLPVCVNVGKDVFIGKELAYAFAYPSETPTLYAMKGMI